MVQAKGQIGAAVHACQQFLIWGRALDVYPRAEEFGGALGAFGHAAQAGFGGFYRAHGGVVLEDRGLAEGLRAAKAFFAKRYNASGRDGLIGGGGTEAEKALHGKAFKVGGNAEAFVQRSLCGPMVGIKAGDQSL